MTAGRRKQLVEAARSLHRGGMNIGTAGNLSLRDGAGMLITPSGLDYRKMQAEDIVFVGPDGRREGSRPPSSEWRFHLAIYRQFSDASAVVHAHSTHATRRACLLANHGLVCHARGLADALALAQKVEHLAEIYLQCLAVGDPVVLDSAEMARVAEKFRHYGDAGDSGSEK